MFHIPAAHVFPLHAMHDLHVQFTSNILLQFYRCRHSNVNVIPGWKTNVKLGTFLYWVLKSWSILLTKDYLNNINIDFIDLGQGG